MKMKFPFLSLLLPVSLLVVPVGVFACDRPAFVDALTQSISASGERFSETFQPQPGHEGTCVYALTWVKSRAAPDTLIGVYVATYKKTGLNKIADLHYNFEDLLWYGPQVKIDPVNFRIHPNRSAFGIRVSWSFLAGTFSTETEQLDLLVPDENGNLRSVLSTIISSGHYQKECPVVCRDAEKNLDCMPRCDGDDTSAKGILIIGERKTGGYHDLTLKSTIRYTDPNGERPERKEQRVTRYSWDVDKYAQH